MIASESRRSAPPDLPPHFGGEPHRWVSSISFEVMLIFDRSHSKEEIFHGI